MKLKAPILTLLITSIFACTMAIAEEEPSEQVKRMDASARVLEEIMGTPDKGIPEELLDSAECVAVVNLSANGLDRKSFEILPEKIFAKCSGVTPRLRGLRTSIT